MKRLAKVLLIGIVIAAVYWFLTNRFMFISPGELEIALTQQADSGISGTAKLVDTDLGMDMVLELSDGSQGYATIHKGNCANLGEALYGLSDTNVDVKITDLARQRPLVINIVKSEFEPLDSVACGEVNF